MRFPDTPPSRLRSKRPADREPSSVAEPEAADQELPVETLGPGFPRSGSLGDPPPPARGRAHLMAERQADRYFGSATRPPMAQESRSMSDMLDFRADEVSAFSAGALRADRDGQPSPPRGSARTQASPTMFRVGVSVALPATPAPARLRPAPFRCTRMLHARNRGVTPC